MVKIPVYAVDNDCMSLRHDHYLRLAHNSHHSTANGEKTYAAGVAGVLLAALMLMLLIVTVEHLAVSAGDLLRPIVPRSLPGMAK